MNNSQKKSSMVSAKSFAAALIVIFILMIAAYLMTLFIPSGIYRRVENADGNLVVDTEGGFSYVEGGIPFWKWLLSPILVLGADGNVALIAVIAFLLVIGGIFNSLDKCGLIKYMLDKITRKFGSTRYRLMAVLIFFFMALGSLIGSFEECVPLVPIVVALSVHLGWNAIVGISMSLLSVGCGFAAGVCNPFTVGVAQQLAGLPMFSGIWLRLVSFALIYALLFSFTYLYAKRIERPLSEAFDTSAFRQDVQMDHALLCFAVIVGIGIAAILVSPFVPAIQDLTMIIVAVMFLVAGITSCLVSRMKLSTLGSTSLSGVLSVLPAVLMILMASSIKYTLEEAHTLDTVLHGAVELSSVLPKFSVILFIYLIVLIANFFIPSGSAKAFMLIPLIVPIAQIFGISTQLCILAFAFGDGFSNVFYPTNPALLISLGLADTSYGKWFKWSVKFQGLNLLLTCAVLMFGFFVGY